MTKKLIVPVRGTIYTLQQIEQDLELSDSPSLCFKFQGVECAVQNSHVTSDQLLSIPAFGETEWIPIFKYMGQTSELLRFVSIDPELDPIDERPSFWVVPRDFPRPQFVREDRSFSHKPWNGV